MTTLRNRVPSGESFFARMPTPARAPLQLRVNSVVVFLLMVSASVWSGCSILPEAAVDPTRYYVLGTTATIPEVRDPQSGVAVALRSIDLPTYLRNTKSLVIRRGPHEVRYEDYARWAEPLDAGLMRVLREQLSQSSGVRSVVTFPLLGADTREVDIRIRITQCEGGVGADGAAVALFAATYEFIRSEGEGEVLGRYHYIAPILPYEAQNFAQLAERLSESAAALANDIAQRLPTR
ncbi:MAG TPA: ABC-type transport auxiliary lipoprotein family protein [Opitutaceae bacterium]|nr:ABC-type transport auxiliary lipoprotein family protein [Opitutaceae bacterium]